MRFRKAIKGDFEYMASHSINQAVDRKEMLCVDFLFTLEHEEKPLALGGFRMISTNTAWCWIDLSDEAGKHIIIVYRAIKEWIDSFVKEHEIGRLQAFVRTDSEEAERFVKHLGFEKESTMKGFYKDGNAYMYVRII